MPNAKHTPGPWAVETGETFTDIAIVTVDGMPVANMDTDHDLTPFESEANARLIAAAPEMLEALQQVKRLEVEHDLQTLDDVMGFVYRSIAKATGTGSEGV